MQTDLIISIKEARKILGKEAENLSDDQIEDLIINLQSIAKLYIQSVPKY